MADSSDYKVLYVEENEAVKQDPKVSPILLKSLVASGLPEAFLDDVRKPTTLPTPRRFGQGSPYPPIHVIVSTGSGTGQALPVWEQVVQPTLESLDLRIDLHYALHITESATTVAEITRDVILPRSNEGTAQLIVLLTGDGGVVDVVNTLLSSERTDAYKRPAIALLPLGTGNALAHSAKITADATLGLKTLVHGSPKPLPVFRTSFSPGARLLVNEARDEQELDTYNHTPVAYGTVVCSWGLHATLVADSDTVEYRKFGAERFKMAAGEALFPKDGSQPHAYKGTVSILRVSSDQWQAIDRSEHAYVLATLVSELEKGFTISPNTKPLDGQLRVVHFAPGSGKEAMEIMGGAYAGGKHIEDQRVGYEDIVGLKIEFDEDDGRWRRVCVDGKIIRVEQGGWVELRMGVQSVVDLLVL